MVWGSFDYSSQLDLCNISMSECFWPHPCLADFCSECWWLYKQTAFSISFDWWLCLAEIGWGWGGVMGQEILLWLHPPGTMYLIPVFLGTEKVSSITGILSTFSMTLHSRCMDVSCVRRVQDPFTNPVKWIQCVHSRASLPPCLTGCGDQPAWLCWPAMVRHLHNISPSDFHRHTCKADWDTIVQATNNLINSVAAKRQISSPLSPQHRSASARSWQPGTGLVYRWEQGPLHTAIVSWTSPPQCLGCPQTGQARLPRPPAASI